MSTTQQHEHRLKAIRLFWENTVVSSTLSDDLSIVHRDNFDHQKLANWIKTFYTGKYPYDWHQKLTTEAIKQSNLPAVKLLWKSIGYFDNDDPRYYLDLGTATEYSNYDTFNYILNGFINNMRLWSNDETYTVAELTVLANKNSDVKVQQHILTLGSPTTIIKCNY